MKKNIKVFLFLLVFSVITLSLNINFALAFYDYESEDDLYFVQWYNDIGIVNTVQRLEVEVGCEYDPELLEVYYTQLGYIAMYGAERPFPVFAYFDGVRWYQDGDEIYNLRNFVRVPIIYEPSSLCGLGRNDTSFFMSSSAGYYQRGSCHLYMPECIPMSITNNVKNDVK